MLATTYCLTDAAATEGARRSIMGLSLGLHQQKFLPLQLVYLQSLWMLHRPKEGVLPIMVFSATNEPFLGAVQHQQNVFLAMAR